MTVLSPSVSSFQLQFPLSESGHSFHSHRAFEFKTPAPITPTTDINVMGEILPSPSISQQFGVSLTPDPDNTQLTNNFSSNMSSTIEATSMSTFQPTAEGGYKDSPMAHIIRQYKEDSSNDNTSTWQHSTTLTTKTCLLRSDIVELGSLEKSYSLRSSLLKGVTQVVNELQIFFERASALIPE